MNFFIHWRYPGTWKLFRLDDRLLLIIVGMVVGACSGLASVVLNRSLAAMLEWLHPFRHIWWGFLLPGLGAALSSIFLNKIMKEGAGHGTGYPKLFTVYPATGDCCVFAPAFPG